MKGINHCNRCGSDWEQRKKGGTPVQCPRCKRVDWAKPSDTKTNEEGSQDREIVYGE